MKTAEEKAKELCFIVGVEGSLDAYMAIRRAILEQDRDTRHACAEAVDDCQPLSYDEDLILRDQAYNACMNAKAV